MQEDFLHFIWKHKRFDSSNLQSVNREVIKVSNLGQHNHNSGPDFFNALIEIDTQKWAGNIEIHIKSSDWYLHGHETDSAYDNVILHVVWEHDTDIFRKDNSVIPTLELKSYVDTKLLQNYTKLMQSKRWINCETDFGSVDDFSLNNWLERLYIERLERKSNEIHKQLKGSKNDWEAVLFKMLCKNFGLKVNGEAFKSLANAIDFSIIRKVRHNVLDLEALLFGQAGLLEENVEDAYAQDLQKRYTFLKQKFQLNNQGVLPIQFFRLRPPNFPTIRLSQLAMLFHKEQNLFSKLIDVQTIDGFYKLFEVEASEFWSSHYTFLKESKSRKKKLTPSFIDLLLINTILPITFSHAKSLGKPEEDALIKLVSQLKIEKNSIVDKFLTLKDFDTSAMTSQSLIQLKTEYCDKNKCLQCAIGNALVVKNK